MRWLYEDGIGEARAALVADGRILAAAVEPAGTLAVGSVVAGRLAERLPRGAGRVLLDDGTPVLARVPPGPAEGARLRVLVTREAIPERGERRPARGTVTDATETAGPDLLARITATGLPVDRPRPHEPDALEAAGWSELLAEAGGDVAFPGGRLRMSVTPAMTLLDVDGHLDPAALALAAAAAAAAAVGRHGIGGSVGIDFPTLAGRAERQAVAAALDAGLAALPFEATAWERTAVNGFGFLQLVRPRPRASLPELLGSDPAAAAARAWLRLAEREPPGRPAPAPPPAVARTLAARPAWIAELARRTGVPPRMDLRA